MLEAGIFNIMGWQRWFSHILVAIGAFTVCENIYEVETRGLLYTL